MSADGKIDSREGTLGLAIRLLRMTGGGEGARIVIGLLLLLVGSGLGLLQPWPMKWVIDGVVGGGGAPRWLWGMVEESSHPRLKLLALLCAGLVIIEILLWTVTVLSTWVLVSVGLKMVFKLRVRLFDHIQKLSLRFHDQTTVGDSLYRVTWDTYAVQAVFNTGMIPALTAIVTLVGISWIMVRMDWTVAVVALGVAVPLALLVKWMDRPMTESSLKVHERESEISTRVQETLSGIRAVMAFGREGFESERFRSRASESLRASLKLTILQTVSQAVVGLVLAVGTAAIIWISARRALEGKLQAGDVVLVTAYMVRLFKPLETLAYTAGHIQAAIAGGRRVFNILDTRPDVEDRDGAIELERRATGDLGLETVSFAYRQEQEVLHDVSLNVPAGQTVALVGPSGAGKTTLISLLMRFYDPSDGRIRLDGRDLRDISLASLRRNVSLVLQEPVLFSASIRENIAYGRPGASEEQIIAAARAAGAHDFITALPDGYEAEIGERGVALSGGQRQRLSIARAFLKDAPVLIMDEPTSALDAETEHLLLEAMERLKEGRTTIIIAHRLSTIRSADLIVVMKEGRLVETGTHEELIARGGLYSRLHAVQFGTASAAAAPAAVAPAAGAAELPGGVR